MSVVLIGGDEPYLVDVKRKSLIGKMQMPELNLLSTELLDETVLDHLTTCPVMDEQRLAVVTVEKLADADNEFFKECLDAVNGLLIVLFRSYDGRSAFFKQVQKDGLLHLCTKQEAAPSLGQFLLKRAAKSGVSFQEGAIAELLRRVDYLENDSVNIYTLLGYLESLKALNTSITVEDVKTIVSEHAREQVFGIVDMIQNKNLHGLTQQAQLLKDNAIGTLSALLREYRIAYKAQYFPLKDIGVSNIRLKGCSKDYLMQGIELITVQVASLKRGSLPPEMVMMDTFLRLIHMRTP